MSVKREKVEGELRIDRIPKDLCWGKPEDFVKTLVEALSVTLFTNSGNDFVVIGHQVPAPEDKGRLWIRLSQSGIFQGFYLFQLGKWQRIHNYRSDEVIWITGDSRDIPSGFQLIDSNTGGITSDVRDFIISKYRKNQALSTATLNVYDYFAVRYVGAT